MLEEVLVLGAGAAGKAVLSLARERGLRTTAVVRSARDVDGHRVVVAPVFGAELAALAGPATHVVVTFPPDGATDARVDLRAGAITYLSSTGVYGDRRGTIDDTTPVTTSPRPTAARRLEAERIWRPRGATILRCPAIYSADRGLHLRIRRGEHRIPGDGSGYVSRIHVDDLAAFVLAAPRAPGETFVIGDETPRTHRDLASRICAAYGLPLPPSVPLEEVHETLRGDRRVDASRARALLGVSLRHPDYAIPP